jgi:hypothetical protein
MERAIKKEDHQEPRKRQFKLNEEHKFKGIWWFPSSPKVQFSGILNIYPDRGIFLNLMNSFNFEEFAKKETLSSEELKKDIMLGISCNGEEITLQGCSELASSFSPIGVKCISMTASTVLIGAHLEESDDIKFKSISVNLTHLDEWADESGFEILYTPDVSHSVSYKYLNPIQISKVNNFTIFLNFEVRGPKIPTASTMTEAKMKQIAFLKLVSLGEKPLKEYMEIIGHIQSFLSLPVRTQVYPLIIKAIKGFKDPKNKEKEIDIPIQIIYHIPDIPKKINKIIRHSMLFSLSDVKKKLESLIGKWISNSEFFEAIYDIYFFTLDNPRMLLQNQFLNLIQAIESYHRIIMKNHEISPKKYEVKIEKILNNIPNEYKGWLKKKLKYGNEPSLRSRLKQIIKEFSDVTERFISDKRKFIQKVVITRNYLSHLDPKSKKAAAKGGSLFDIIQRLKIILIICLLNHLGFSINDIEKIMKRDKWYKRYRVV